ncbi:MAG: glycosyltransferase, partial [Betaproteobacteria bacterium]
MKASIVLTSYNYEKFAVECVKSVAEQTYKNIEIVFVDDGSTDGTLALINKLKHEQLKIVAKSNGGQLSAFNAALPYITGDIVFFIDADDVYEADYVKKTIEFYKDNSDADFVYSGLSYFGDVVEPNLSKNTKNHGFTLCKAYFLRHWIGAPTTAISMRKNILNKILPLDLELDWRVRADDCLVWGSSLVGAKKYYFGVAEIKYRIHNANN